MFFLLTSSTPLHSFPTRIDTARQTTPKSARRTERKLDFPSSASSPPPSTLLDAEYQLPSTSARQVISNSGLATDRSDLGLTKNFFSRYFFIFSFLSVFLDVGDYNSISVREYNTNVECHDASMHGK